VTPRIIVRGAVELVEFLRRVFDAAENIGAIALRNDGRMPGSPDGTVAAGRNDR
jgi:hypothetical protein